MMSDLHLVFLNVNEDGEIYDEHADLDSALSVLRQFPNDHIIVKLRAKEN